MEGFNQQTQYRISNLSYNNQITLCLVHHFCLNAAHYVGHGGQINLLF